jgi:glyoxylase-like metal-dependent hydrolase (beta-lactamase superfamily II)
MNEMASKEIRLNWDVFVTPGIPNVTHDIASGGTRDIFSGDGVDPDLRHPGAVLVDAFMTVKQANALADWVAARGKRLTTIYITHGHGDHWFGVDTLLERFPNARAVATPNVVTVMRQHASQDFLEKIWKAGFPGPDSRPASDRGGTQEECN